MTDFKFNIGDKIRAAERFGGLHENGQISYRFHGYENHYVLRTEDGIEYGAYCEDELESIPSTPSDVEGEEIGVGDLVQPINGACVGRVAATDLGSGMIAVNPALAAFSEDWAAKFTRILEKAPPKQISLGSRVRVKVTGEEFHVGSGWRGAFGDLHWRRHAKDQSKNLAFRPDQLELIE